ncbi:MAG: DUF6142 family protein [Eubacteriales bacterium]|nr:DUF6142 family protein [Eubacteriales bacterium]
MKKPGFFLFTNKQQSPRGWMSASFGVISLTSMVIALYLTFANGGQAQQRYGTAVLLNLLIAVTGFVLGVLSRKEPDRFYLFAYLGMIFNGIVIVLGAVILYQGLLP